MSASITAAPARSSFGRFPMALAALALVIVAGLAVAIVAMNTAKAVAPAASAAKGAPPAVKYLVHPQIGPSAVEYGQSVSNVPFYDHGWSKINEPGQSVSNVPFYDHGWSIAGTSTTPKAGYPLFGASYFGSRIDSIGYPPFGATFAGSRIDAVDHGARDERVIEPQYVAPRPRNQ